MFMQNNDPLKYNSSFINNFTQESKNTYFQNSNDKEKEIVFQQNLLPIFQNEDANLESLEKNQFIYVDDEIWEIKNFLNCFQCNALIECSKNLGYKEATIFDEQNKLRDMSRMKIQDKYSATLLSQRIEKFVPLAYEGGIFIGLNDVFRFLQYQENQYYKNHLDGQIFYKEKNEKSLISLIIYLNNVSKGGNIIFYNEAFQNNSLTIQPEEGKLLLYRQEQLFYSLINLFILRGWLHESSILEKGQKFVLRTDLLYRYCTKNQIKKFLPQQCGLCKQEVKIEMLEYCDHVFFHCKCNPFYGYEKKVKFECKICGKQIKFQHSNSTKQNCNIF